MPDENPISSIISFRDPPDPQTAFSLAPIHRVFYGTQDNNVLTMGRQDTPPIVSWVIIGYGVGTCTYEGIMSYVLIVDDDKNTAEAIAAMVRLFDWDTQIAHGPRAALQVLQRTPPALILLDLNMPGVDGMEVCRYIKRDPMAQDTPVVFVTAEDDPSIMQRAREVGAMDYLVKPLDIDRLEQILSKLPGSPGA